MPRVYIPEQTLYPDGNDGARVELPIDLTRTAWASTFSGGAAVNETTPGNFTNPSADTADRIPELELAGGGTPGTYTLIGTWNSRPRTQSITTVAGATVKAALPMDTITSITGPDPGANLDLYQGDSYADPPARALATGAGGQFGSYLSGNPNLLITRTLPGDTDHQRHVQRIDRDVTAAALDGDIAFLW
jgi:hypothetical protein